MTIAPPAPDAAVQPRIRLVRFAPAPAAGQPHLTLVPAPATMIAGWLAGVGAECGEPLSMTVTAPVHTAVVHVGDPVAFQRWATHLRTTGACLLYDELGAVAAATVRRDGWEIRVQYIGGHA